MHLREKEYFIATEFMNLLGKLIYSLDLIFFCFLFLSSETFLCVYRRKMTTILFSTLPTPACHIFQIITVVHHCVKVEWKIELLVGFC